LGAREPRAEELASAESGNLGLNKAVIRWMSVERKMVAARSFKLAVNGWNNS